MQTRLSSCSPTGGVARRRLRKIFADQPDRQRSSSKSQETRHRHEKFEKYAPTAGSQPPRVPGGLRYPQAILRAAQAAGSERLAELARTAADPPVKPRQIERNER